MESLLGLAIVHWDHEPVRIPSTALRAPSPPLGEKDGMRGLGSWKEADASARNLESGLLPDWVPDGEKSF